MLCELEKNSKTVGFRRMIDFVLDTFVGGYDRLYNHCECSSCQDLGNLLPFLQIITRRKGLLPEHFAFTLI